MKYFAYGMNTNQNEMALRCPDAVSLGEAVLPDHEFRFARHADVIYYPGFETRGVLWEITDECEHALDALEGFPTYYLKKTVTVDHYGEEVEAMVYYMAGDVPDEVPSDSYLMMLYEGYAQHNISARQIVESLDYINAYHTALAKKGQYFYG